MATVESNFNRKLNLPSLRINSFAFDLSVFIYICFGKVEGTEIEANFGIKNTVCDS